MIKQASHDNRRKNFASITAVVDYPDLLDIQLESFKNFFQLETSNEKKKLEGLYKVFKENFPVSDTRENFVLEFIDYALDAPKYSQEECISRGVTSAIPLKVKLRLSCNDKNNEDFQTIEQEVFLGTIPYMTTKGSFIINGIERVVVAQLHKSPGAFFLKSKHTSGVILYSVRVIPFKGAWMEFSTDINNVMYVYIDRKKKFPVTTLLRAIGYDTDKEILDIFGLSEEVPANKKILKQKIGRTLGARVLKTWVEDFVDEDTGEVISVDRHEVLLERAIILDEETIEIILKSGVKFVILQRSDINILDYSIIYNTLQKDNANSEKEATEQIYRQLRNADPPDERTARETVQGLFFSNRRYDLGEVGRYKINKKLGTNISFDVRVLTQEDIIEIVKHLIQLINAKAVVDDIDHLSNRRVKVVGEQLYAQFGVGISRMVRTIKERMNVRDNENFKPADLVNPRILSSVINSFFGTNPLSQFMDQVNPLAEVTHKRRLSSLGPGGLSKDRAGFEVRDVHYTHYGRLCTVETPEGPNIGLISSLCVYAKINNMGFIETPYKKVKKGQINMSRHVDYLTAEEEDSCNIVQANVALDKQGKFINNKVKVRFEGDFPFVLPEDINYMDVGPNQIAGVAASLIPFLEHDDANRVLMGSNMQRQAVPLLQPDSPIVGTGLERHIAKDFRGLVCAEKNGVIEYVDATKIVVQYQLSQEEEFISFEKSVKTYNLLKFKGTNHYTCINLRPIVLKGDKVKKGQVLCEGYATQNGELALGKNLQVAFMPWRGYNFEDAIVISEKIVQQDIFTSVHIEKFELEIRDTKLGEEEFTAEIPNVSEEAVKNLDENGIIRVGAEVKEGDILIGKITPKVKSDATPEEKFLRAIFGDKAGDVKNVSLHMPSSTTGVVIDVRLFSKSQKNKQIRVQIKKELEALKKYYSTKLLSLRTEMIKKLSDLLQGENSMGIYHKFGDILIEKKIALTAQVIETKLFSHKNIYSDETHYHIPEEVNLIADVVLDHWTANESKNRILKVLVKNYNKRRNHILGHFKKEKFVLEVGDELPTGILKLANVYVAKKKKLQVGDKMSGRHGNKGVVAKIVAEADMPFLPDGTRVDLVLNPLGVAARMNLGQIYETVLGWAGLKLGKKYATPIFNGASVEDVAQELAKAGLPKFGKTQLYDGLTGEKFDQKVTVGVIYMLKLNHLVDDKMHARSIGPYSLITQQPLGGKSQFGGQRFGEMEVWSLEAFGAAHTLQEMLTIKSDDIVGRGRAYAAIVKGENIPKPNPPESFKVLVHELRGLGLEITYS